MKLYLFKEEPREVAIIFVYNDKAKGTLASKIDLALESFAVGDKAGRLFRGEKGDEAEATPAGPM